MSFDYDTAGNRISSQITDHESQVTAVEYGYNNFNQLIRSTTSVTSGTQPQPQTQTVTYEYDQAGRLTSSQVTDHESQITTVSYGYNPFGHLVSVISDTHTPTQDAHVEAAYAYSFDGKRISKYLDGTLTDYTWDGTNLLETYADNAGRIAKYTYGTALISQSSLSGTPIRRPAGSPLHSDALTYTVLTDYQNSVSALLDPSTSHDPQFTTFAYSPFGKFRYTSSEGAPQTLGWLSRQFDSETGNHYLINRYYNAPTARFLSPDRYQYVSDTTPFTFNLYQYAYANPLRYTDADGLRVEDKDGLRYQTVATASGAEIWIPQSYYDQLNNLIGHESGAMRVFDPDGHIQLLTFTGSDLSNGTVATRVFESRMLALHGEERALDAVQITSAAAGFVSNLVAAMVTAPVFGIIGQSRWVATGLGLLTAGTASHHFGERLAERQVSGSSIVASVAGATLDSLMVSDVYAGFTNRDIITGEPIGYSLERRASILGGFSGGIFAGWELTVASSRDLPGRIREIQIENATAGPSTWNEFQRATAGMFGSRTEAGVGWRAYKNAKYTDKTLVIGRLRDTELAELAGYQRLNTTGWTLSVNDAWIQGVIDGGHPVKLASPIHKSTLSNPPGSRFPFTVYRRELYQLKRAGYMFRKGWGLPYGSRNVK